MIPGFAGADVETIASIMYEYTGAVYKAVCMLHVGLLLTEAAMPALLQCTKREEGCIPK